jgi:hypothetical protein
MAGPRAVFQSHDYRRLPVARTLTLTKMPHGIRATFKWLQNDADADRVRNAFEQHVLGASVGFIVPEGGAEPNAYGGYHYRRSILSEWSLTGNPANPECIRTLKALGLARGADDAGFDAVSARAARRVAIGLRLHAAVRQAVRRAGLAEPGMIPVLLLADPDEQLPLTEANVLDAIGPAMARAITGAARQAVNDATGRLD